jgi:transposase
MRKYKFFVGIDISKPFIDIALHQGTELLLHKQVDNNPLALEEMVKELKLISGLKIFNTVFGMEQSGFYSNLLIGVLQKHKAAIVNENSVRIKNSLGLLRGKNDKLDAIRIAVYLYKARENLSLWGEKRQLLIELSALVSVRNRLSTTLTALKMPLKEEKGFIPAQFSKQNELLCHGSIHGIKADILTLEKRIKVLWSSDEQVNELMRLITSVPCVGDLTALQIILTTNEFRNISCPKKFACYAGVAPFPYQSGTSKLRRSRVSHMANKKMKSLLHTCAILAVRFVPELKAYFLRKTLEEGKSKMLVYNAVRSKLILRVFSCVRQQRVYQVMYTGDRHLS